MTLINWGRMNLALEYLKVDILDTIHFQLFRGKISLCKELSIYGLSRASRVLDVSRSLFSDTKFSEDIGKQVICGYFSGDFSEVMQRLSDVHRHKVIGDLIVDAIDYIHQCIAGL